MKILQIVVTRTALGQYKISTMGLADSGMGQTLENYRGGFLSTLWRLIRLIPKVEAPK